MNLLLHVPNASPAELERGLAVARAVFSVGEPHVCACAPEEAHREAAALHALAELAALEACLAGAPVPPGCWLELIALC